MTSAHINPRSKSECIVPAADGALVFFRIVQHLTSSTPAVKNYIKSSANYELLIIRGKHEGAGCLFSENSNLFNNLLS